MEPSENPYKMIGTNITFLGTGGAWGLPELNCDCFICRDMRKRNEKRQRTALLLSGKSTILIDCGPDIASQLSRHDVKKIDAVFISHEHGDHYMGLDELFSYKRNSPKDSFLPIRVYLTAKSWEVISKRFVYMEEMGVIKVHIIEPGKSVRLKNYDLFPFKTNHGPVAGGSVGFVIKCKNELEEGVRILYTSDFMELPDIPSELFNPDYLIVPSLWLNEPVINRPHHMSFQRAIHFIKKLKPKKETFLVHIGDSDMAADDPANSMAKKTPAKDPLRPIPGGDPYPIPLNHSQWQKTVGRIMDDRALPYNVIVAYDDLRISF